MPPTALEIRTQRLLLVAGNAELSRAELEDPTRFAALLDAAVAPEWPPPLNDENSMRWSLRFHETQPDGAGWGNWYFLRVLPDGRRVAVGNGGYQGVPSAAGEVEIGYSILESHQRQGYAPEAVRALLAWAFAHREVRRVRAHTLPELGPSIRVLEKCGFRHVGPGAEEGTIRFELPRSPRRVDLEGAADAVSACRSQRSTARCLLVGVSGIDAAGKGYVAHRLVDELQQRGIRAAAIGADGWLNLPEERFDTARPAPHFYENALRLEEMFSILLLPLSESRSVDVVADLAEETAHAYHSHRYRFQDLDVAVVEGIYLFKRLFRPHFDLALWVECSFETALERALRRGQEGLGESATQHAYDTIYFPAQRLHFEFDAPRDGADLILMNDDRFSRRGAGLPPAALDPGARPA